MRGGGFCGDRVVGTGPLMALPSPTIAGGDGPASCVVVDTAYGYDPDGVGVILTAMCTSGFELVLGFFVGWQSYRLMFGGQYLVVLPRDW
jgi:hypothetical protein